LRLPARTRFPSRCACLAQHLLVSCLSSIPAAKATSSNVELQVTDCFDGSHQVSFDAVPNGKYQVSAYIDSKQMTACPLPLTIVAGSTSATNCTVQGQGLEQATAGNEPPRAQLLALPVHAVQTLRSAQESPQPFRSSLETRGKAYALRVVTSFTWSCPSLVRMR
jgi:hypothetical protein